MLGSGVEVNTAYLCRKGNLNALSQTPHQPALAEGLTESDFEVATVTSADLKVGWVMCHQTKDSKVKRHRFIR